MKYHIITFGCQQNVSDSERISSYFQNQGFLQTSYIKDADQVIINTCMIRQSAEDRTLGTIRNIDKARKKGHAIKIILTGCIVGMAFREKTGKMMNKLKQIFPSVDEFFPIEEIGFNINPIRSDKRHAYLPISNGCNNFCTFCVVPFTRGREISRPYHEIIKESQDLANNGYKHITLLGQNVNSYGADLIIGEQNVQVMRDLPDKQYFKKINIQNPKIMRSQTYKSIIQNLQAQDMIETNKITYVKHLGRLRIPTLFPQLLNDLCQIKGIDKIDFMSSNPWDFSDDLIDIISKNPKISKSLHIAVQSGDNQVLKKMNRWYTRIEFMKLVTKLKAKIKNLKLSTDIIVGFCGETENQFKNTVKLCQDVGFYKAYISIYSDRPMTAAHKVYKDNVPYTIKKRRWQILETLINNPIRSQ